MTEVTYQVEPLTPDRIPVWMLSDHYKENNKFDALKLKPDWDYYISEQKAGRFFFVSARARTGELVGYMAMFLRRHPHYADAKIAIDDVHYLMPAYRNLGYGVAMISFAESIAREAGATVFSLRCKNDEPHGGIFEALGYKLTDLVYVKDIRHAL